MPWAQAGASPRLLGRSRPGGNEDAVPIGTNSQPADKLYGRADLEAVLLRASQSPWFNLSFNFMHIDEPGELQALVAGSNADRLYSKPCWLVRKHRDQRRPPKYANGRLLEGSRHCACLVTSSVYVAWIMNDLVDAILDHDLARVRKLMHVNSELASSRSQAGYLPLDIARSSGNAFTHVSLLRLGAPSEALQTPDYVWLLIEYISQLSESRACAGWLSDIEFMVYANVIGDSLNAKDPHGFGELDGETLADLRFLLERSGKWPCWVADECAVRAIPIADWQPLYHNWHDKYAT